MGTLRIPGDHADIQAKGPGFTLVTWCIHPVLLPCTVQRKIYKARQNLGEISDVGKLGCFITGEVL